MTKVAGLVLAAGAGRRYGLPKALVERAGRRLVDHAAITLARGGTAPVMVVLGAAAAEVRAAAQLRECQVVLNPRWDTGMGSSLRAGLVALAATDAVAAVVMLVDQPLITDLAVRRITTLAAPSALVMAGYKGRRGHPVLLGRDHWNGAAELAVGDQGARAYLRTRATQIQTVECADVADDTDLDLPSDNS